ncbi:MAG TPA: MotA/TolQ/ExbB proton channel family protein [bacterium]|nr:MotA/TolQ/ExbB proton channel family protein [bacterium]
MNLLGIAGVLGQAEQAIEASNITSGDHSLITLVMNANTVVQLALLLLVFFSVVSWAIIGSKHRQLKQARQRSDKFYSLFWQAKSIDAIVSKGSFRKSPAFNVFKAGVDTLRENQTPHAERFIEKEIRRTAEDEIEQMEYGVPFLATTGSAAPFIGLFGTTWGILMAFWKIGRTGASSLAIVGPHIAEALIATAIGLAAAIPAVIFYNLYVNKIRLISKDLIDFSDDLVSRIQREYFPAS